MDKSHDHFERKVDSGMHSDSVPDHPVNAVSEIGSGSAGVGGFAWFMIFFSLYLLFQAMTSSGQGTAAT